MSIIRELEAHAERILTFARKWRGRIILDAAGRLLNTLLIRRILAPVFLPR